MKNDRRKSTKILGQGIIIMMEREETNRISKTIVALVEGGDKDISSYLHKLFIEQYYKGYDDCIETTKRAINTIGSLAWERKRMDLEKM